ncbi:MOSC domain-containing protein [Lyngbya confervoides]|uniref:MOSC domain-containing protein n=1 Tax=Lyngbya confervoides BDU141951 TaxID=1574623 RepID=A0ABD4T3L8_9CYAN|nr:MOSC domain-containing protein [Lyngbya confervoides]MCM1983251.1 MOSC domain-containing protein [Lyngbya confervoides BDU141951]
MTSTRITVATMQVGLPKTLGQDDAPDPMDRLWRTGFFKRPVVDPIWLGATNLEGDGQADLKNHGGVDKAVLAYSAHHYDYWKSHLHWPELPYGAFGENFTIVGQTESEVCVGDTYGLGEAKVQVSQPRKPCWKLSRRWRIPDLAQQVLANGRSGWYFRVLQEGLVAPGQAMRLIHRPYPEWTIARAHQIMHHDFHDRAATLALANCPLLSENWREKLIRRTQSP